MSCAVSRLAVIAIITPVMAASLAAEQSDDACTLTTDRAGTVTRVIDAETVVLDDRRTVRLIGAKPPSASDAAIDANTNDTTTTATSPLQHQAKSFLEALVLGKPVQLAYGATRRDRHGHELAHLFTTEHDASTWVQGAMLLAGLARAYGLPGSFACINELKAHEAVAREADLGLWQSPIYATRSARAPGRLMRRRNQFERVSGVVQKVAVTKSATYLNFGDTWKSDFTIRVGKDVLKQHQDFAATLSGLEGRTITVSGWIERRNGPMIDLWHPGQLDLAPETGTTAPNVVGSQADPPLSQSQAPSRAAPGADTHAATPPNENPATLKTGLPGDLDL